MAEPRFELRSEEVQDILSYIPHWIIRWGITVIFLTILILISISWIIKYPDSITATIVLTTKNPPIGVIAKSSGTLKLFVGENQYVTKNTYLATIANPDSMPDIFEFKKQIEVFRNIIALPDSEPSVQVNDKNHGRQQVDYTGFLQNYFTGKYFNQANYQADKIKTVLAQIIYYKELNRKLVQQKNILARDLLISEKKHQNDKTLFKQQLISEEDRNKSESAYLQKRYTLEQAKTEIITNKITLVEYQKIALEFINQLSIWEEQYILKTPVDGYVSFFKFWSDNQFVNAGEEVLAIVPDCNDIIGKIYLPQASSGKVKVSQKVKIKFDSYPYAEYGSVEGLVENISLVSRENKYAIDVGFKNGLKSSYSKKIVFKQGMQGKADIITEELRLLERFFYKFKYFFTDWVK
jgi:HlyD family secretion protein